jgi:hypothetical protein
VEGGQEESVNLLEFLSIDGVRFESTEINGNELLSSIISALLTTVKMFVFNGICKFNAT